jgi:hypothetical protein
MHFQVPLKKYAPYVEEQHYNEKKDSSVFSVSAAMRESITFTYPPMIDLIDCHCDSFIEGELCIWNERTKCIRGPCRKRSRAINKAQN